MVSNQFIQSEIELKKLIKKVKNEIIPDIKVIHRITKIIDHCKSAAFQLY